jgi:hypothetical protein
MLTKGGKCKENESKDLKVDSSKNASKENFQFSSSN